MSQCVLGDPLIPDAEGVSPTEQLSTSFTPNCHLHIPALQAVMSSHGATKPVFFIEHLWNPVRWSVRLASSERLDVCSRLERCLQGIPFFRPNMWNRQQPEECHVSKDRKPCTLQRRSLCGWSGSKKLLRCTIH